MKKQTKIAAILALIYLIPTLLLFALLMICFTESPRCPGPAIYYFPLTSSLRWIEWPWGELVPGGMFTGTLWGRAFILSCIGLNAGLIFGGAKLCEWLFPTSCINSRALARHTLSILSSQKKRLLEPRPKVATILVLLYLIPGLFLWIKWQLCSGWKWFCSAPMLSFLAGPWAGWMGWSLTNSNASVEAKLGPLGVRIFVLAALSLNAGIIFSMVKLYQWMFNKLRSNPPRLVGTTVAMTYALLALFIYVDAMRCSGFLCDIGVLLAALPWSVLTDVHFWGSGLLVVLAMLAVNTLILYTVGIWLARPLWIGKRFLSG